MRIIGFKLVRSKIWLLLLIPLSALSQGQEGYQQPRYIQGISENDIYQHWLQSDKHFSNGMHLELAHPIFNNKFSRNFLFGFKSSTPTYQDYSLSAGQDLFTATNTSLMAIDSADRPYAGLLYLDYSRVTNDFAKGRKLKTHFVFGAQGPTAFGEEVQNWVHSQIGNDSVLGWDFQIANGLVLDYGAMFEQLLPLSTPISELTWISRAQFGTMYNYISTGVKFKIGYFRDSFLGFSGLYNRHYEHKVSKEEAEKLIKTRGKAVPKKYRGDYAAYYNQRLKRKFEVHLGITLKARYILYDGTIQGSLIPFRESQYTRSWDQYDHFHVFGIYELNINYKGVQFTFRRIAENDNIDHNQLFGWGELDIMVLF